MMVRSALLLTLAVGSVGVSNPIRARTPHRGGHRTAEAAGPVPYLLRARAAAASGRYGQASDALGGAETRLLNDGAAPPDRAPPFLQRALSDVVAARASAVRGQRTATIEAIDDALLALEPQPLASAMQPTPSSPVAPVTAAAAQPAPLEMPAFAPSRPPAALYRLEPGHWQLREAQSVWVEPQTVLQPVSVEPVVPAREVWNGDRWVLAPEHFADTETAR